MAGSRVDVRWSSGAPTLGALGRVFGEQVEDILALDKLQLLQVLFGAVRELQIRVDELYNKFSA